MGKPAFNPIRDVLSGIIMAATSVPQLIAYAETVGMAGYRGLATAGPPLFAFGLVTGSPFLNAGVTSMSALMTKSDLNGEEYASEYGEQAYVELVAAYSLYVGFASLLLAVVGFGKLAKSVPSPVRSGFKWGCSVGVLVAAIPNGLLANAKLLKPIVAKTAVGAWVQPLKSTLPGAVNLTNVLYALSHPQMWALEPTILFVAGVAFVLRGKKYLPKSWPPGSEVIILTAIATIYSMNFDYPGAVVGKILVLDADAGLTMNVLGLKFQLPVEFLDVRKLVASEPLLERFGGSWSLLALSAILFSGVNFLSMMGILSGFEAEDGIAWSAERELAAQGVSCCVAGAVGSAPVTGSLSRSLVSRMTGTTSQLACIVTAVCWIYLQKYMRIMTPTPKAALSAVIASAVVSAVLVPKALLNLRGWDAATGWITGFITTVVGPTQGFAAGLVVHFLFGLVRSSTKAKKA